MFKEAFFVPISNTHSVHHLFGLERRHSPDLEISEELKRCISYWHENRTLLLRSRKRKRMTFYSVKTVVPQACNNILKQIQQAAHKSGLLIEFSSSYGSKAFIEVFTKDGICETLDARHLRICCICVSATCCICGWNLRKRNSTTSMVSILCIEAVC